MKTDDIESDNAGQTQYQWFYIMIKTFFYCFYSHTLYTNDFEIDNVIQIQVQ
jgi:hypothetical protein